MTETRGDNVFLAEGKDTNWKNNEALNLSATFSSSLHFPSFLLSHSISQDNTALIIAELHRDNGLVESRAAAAEAVWENPCCLLQPACGLCMLMCVLVFYPSCIQGKRQRTEYLLHHTHRGDCQG